LCSEMGLGRTISKRPERELGAVRSDFQIYDARMERKGWYRTIVAAKLCGVNAIWLAYACHVGLVKGSKKSTDLYQDMYRVKLADVMAWKDTL
jgi:hypothetical protein